MTPMADQTSPRRGSRAGAIERLAKMVEIPMTDTNDSDEESASEERRGARKARLGGTGVIRRTASVSTANIVGDNPPPYEERKRQKQREKVREQLWEMWSRWG